MSLDLALMVFHRIEGAEHAYAGLLEVAGQPPWVHEVSFVEHHRHDRIVVRGTFAGRYVDVDERGDVIGKRTAEGALTGAAAGLFFGPAGLAVGIVAGGAVGGMSESERRRTSTTRSWTRSVPRCPRSPRPCCCSPLPNTSTT